MTTVLLTGFGPFGTTLVNPAERVATALDGADIDGAKVVGRLVPGSFFKCIEVVQAAITEVKPDIVIMMGEYGGRSMITVERLAQNLNDSARYQLVDNDGKTMQGEPTVPGGPVAYYTTVPIRAMVKAMRAAGVPADISDTPGTNTCNHLLYGILHYVATNSLPIRTGWIHLPYLPVTAAMEQNLGTPSMSVETSAEGVRAGIQAALENSTDIQELVLSRWQI
jgi:pyroglutamyl-peptidase